MSRIGRFLHLLGRRKLAVSSSIAAIILAISTEAHSSTISLPAATAYANYSIYDSNDNFMGLPTTQKTVSGAPGVQTQYVGFEGKAVANTFAYPAGGVSVSALSDKGVGTGEIAASAQEVYYVSLLGPANVTVPLEVTGKLGASVSVGNDIGPQGSAVVLNAYIDMNPPPSLYSPHRPTYGEGVDEQLNYQVTGGKMINFDSTVDVLCDSPIPIELDAFAYTSGQYISLSGSVDPVFKIDPSFAEAGEFSLAISSGVGNSVAAVPLPAALPLFGVALAGLTTLGVRKSRVNKAALAL